MFYFPPLDIKHVTYTLKFLFILAKWRPKQAHLSVLIKKIEKTFSVSNENQAHYLIDTLHVFKFLLLGLLKYMWVCGGVCYQENLVLKQSLFFFLHC